MVTNAPELFDYGIHNESADLRAHVAVYAQKVYVFPRVPVLRIMKQFPLRPAGQPGVTGPTAMGYCVPISAVPFIREIRLSPERLAGFTEDLDLVERGRRAVEIVTALLKAGRFPLWIEGALVEDVAMQIDGDDIFVKGSWRIQVKCDFRAGVGPHHLCTGNVYLQISERNPRKLW